MTQFSMKFWTREVQEEKQLIHDAYQKLSIAWKLGDFFVVRFDFLPIERANAGKTKKTYINPQLPKPGALSQIIAVPRRRALSWTRRRMQIKGYFHGESVQTPAIRSKSQAPLRRRPDFSRSLNFRVR